MKKFLGFLIIWALIINFGSEKDSADVKQPVASTSEQTIKNTPPPVYDNSVVKNPPPLVDDSSAVKNVVNEFMAAYVSRDRQGMEYCSFYEERQFTKNKGFELLDTQMEVWDTTLDILRQSGQRISYDWSITSLRKINSDNYEVDIAFIMGPDTLHYPGVVVSRVGNYWLIDAESFVVSASLSISNVVLNY
ncbi:MAG: hypothetical protein IJL12_06280 [Selenomonadaceae bacterium]|nr:hypothetical protein [Selenomonadaceae bacterium]